MITIFYYLQEESTQWCSMNLHPYPCNNIHLCPVAWRNCMCWECLCGLEIFLLVNTIFTTIFTNHISIVICKEIYISFTFISKSAPLHSTKGPASSMGIEKSEWTTPFQVTTIWIIGSPCRSTIIIVCSKENSSA